MNSEQEGGSLLTASEEKRVEKAEKEEEAYIPEDPDMTAEN